MDDSSTPKVHFKRRKTTHPKRPYGESGTATVAKSQSPDVATTSDTHARSAAADDEEPVPNLKDIIRNRKRPRDRVKDVARTIEAPPTAELGQVDAPRPGQYTSRFVAQTGQVVDRDDTQMSEYVEARLAEQNHRKYGWPIPKHLQAAVVTIAPDLKHTFAESSSAQGTTSGPDVPVNEEHSNRLAAGQGKLQEVDLGPDAAMRIEEAWKRLDNGLPDEEPANKTRRGKYGYQWRKPKRRNSEAERREQMVEAVLKEAKLDFFDDTAPSNPYTNNSGNNDEAVAERFRTEYLEALEEQQQRKAPPPTNNTRGVKEPSRGPKLGGSKSARAKMRLQEEQAAKAKR
ncbi:hypothetical protein T440DRAFT_289418 [Plenodomus tracheiphilus IPT5]|uniref:Uncharacterized protein n=1 Tax=Plenodomus tracheiphilus IPT5 TaxID=1408161 RepID=A0A6A7BEF4_9PLEO|nr:hypothetical protein T440DRAFT_289418 [Plenodomus tracheiphilus IPT5]